MDGNSHFLMAVGRHDEGHVIETADTKLREVIEAVQRTGKAGSVSVTVSVKGNGELGLKVGAKVTAKAPDLEFGEAFYFTDRQGDLSRTPPQFTEEMKLDGEKA